MDATNQILGKSWNQTAPESSQTASVNTDETSMTSGRDNETANKPAQLEIAGANYITDLDNNPVTHDSQMATLSGNSGSTTSRHRNEYDTPDPLEIDDFQYKCAQRKE